MGHDRCLRLHARQPLCLDQADLLAGARRGGRHRPVACGGRAAHHPGRVRGRPRRGLVPLYGHLPRLCRGRLRDGQGGRQVRHHRADHHCGCIAGNRILPCGMVAELLAVRHRAGGVHRLPRECRHLRAAGGRCLAVVPQAPRHRDCHRGQRQLHRRHHLAALHAGVDRAVWLARHLHGDWRDLHGGHGAGCAVAAQAPAFP